MEFPLKRQNPGVNGALVRLKSHNSIVPSALDLAQYSEARAPLSISNYSNERSPQQLSLFAEPEPTVTIKSQPCPNCGATQARLAAGTRPHYAALRCSRCDRWIKWMSVATCEVLGLALSQENVAVTEISGLLELPTWGEEA